MSKLKPMPGIPGLPNPFVKWTVAALPQGEGEWNMLPPPNPQGFEDGCWNPTHVGRMGNNRVCIRWSYDAGPNDRLRYNAALEALLHAREALLHAADKLGVEVPENINSYKYTWQHVNALCDAILGRRERAPRPDRP